MIKLVWRSFSRDWIFITLSENRVRWLDWIQSWLVSYKMM